MPSRLERRELARMDAGIKLIFLAFVALAFLVGGLSGFAGAFTALVFLAVVIVAVGLIGILILKSSLVPRKKSGLLLIVAALLTGWFWTGARAPRQWPQERAIVEAIIGPPAVTETDYSYRPDEAKKGTVLIVTQTKFWAKLSEAKSYRAAPAAVYFNRTNVSDVHFEPINGWVRTLASPVATRIRVTGEGTATLRVGSSLFTKSATTTGPHVANYTVGATLPVWVNPVSQTELSFQPRATAGGQKYWIVALAGALALGGISALVWGKQWIDPSVPARAYVAFPNANANGRTNPPTSVASQLRVIDWFQFEAVAARILEAEGWAVSKSGGANPDAGADMLAIRNGRKAVVQCKHWRRVEVQPKIIRELLGTKASAQFTADDAILFTLSDCTEAALACARENNVTVYNSDAIRAAIERVGIGHFPELINPDSKQCPKCGAAMVLRDKVETPFWGCSTYPRCRATIERT